MHRPMQVPDYQMYESRVYLAPAVAFRVSEFRKPRVTGLIGVGFSRGKIMFKFRLLGLTLLLLTWTAQGQAQFAHTDHKQIVDAAGKPLLVRATNLGNWMVPEGYMWLFQGGPQSPGEIRALVLELLGPEGSAAFWQKWRENYVTRDDIALLTAPASTPFESLFITACLRATTRTASN